MREIKFMAYDKENDIMIGPFEVGSALSMQWPPEMQYTGYKDKNGKEIYEGHLLSVEINKYKGFVKYSETALCYVVGDFKTFCLSLSSWEPQFIEIIGNIHQNREQA